MQLSYLYMIISVAENAEVQIKILKKRLFMLRMYMRERTFVKFIFAKLLRLVNLSHGLTAFSHRTLVRQMLKTFSPFTTKNAPSFSYAGDSVFSNTFGKKQAYLAQA